MVGALRHALADALAGHSTFVDILAGVHMANPVFQVENHELPFNQRWAKARQLAMDDLRALIDDADRLAEILDLPDDLVKWVYDRVHRNLDLVSWLSEVLAHFFNEKLVYPLPATLAIPANSLKTTNPKLRLLPIQVTIRNPRLTIAPDEVVITLEPGTIEELRE